jgi:hypothetical protein
MAGGVEERVAKSWKTVSSYLFYPNAFRGF